MLELDERNFISQVEQGQAVLIGLCKGAPLCEGFLPFAETSELQCCKLDLTAQPGLAQRLSCHRVTPSLLLLQEGKVIQRFWGNYDSDALERILRSR
ncbi:MAG: hypothetical protein IJ453_05110 [Oscillospiraceae bacterium]|nr:hypothetical protein [Oscillospiraceae bacterium]